MKANLKGLSGIKGLVLRHGEKVVIAVMGLVAVWFMYSSMQLPRLNPEFQADKLQGKISQTNTAIDNSAWPEEGTEEEKDVRIYKPIAKAADDNVDEKKYPFPGFDPSVVSQTQLRGDPPILNAQEVKAIGQSGVLGFKDANTLKEQERLRQLREEEAQKERDVAAKRQQDQTAEGQIDRKGRRAGPAEGPATEVFDPEHPKRRMLEGVVTSAGVPLAGGERLERVSWAIVVAKVPIREQLKQYQDAFRNARGYDATRDFPQYVGYQVQRREIVGSEPTEWKVVNVYDGQKKRVGPNVNMKTVADLNQLASAEWAGQALEPVDPRWTDPVLTLPLPPLVGRNFGEDATHPDIPLAIHAPPPEDLAVPAESTTTAPQEGEADEGFNTGLGAQQRPGGTEFAPRPMAGFGGAESFGMRRGTGMPGMPMGGLEGELGERRGAIMPGSGMMPSGGISTTQRTTLPREVDHLLLRFLDYTVEPGKEYQYRVMIYILDPNNAIALQSGALESAVIDRRLNEIQAARTAKKNPPVFRPADQWSEPSPIVGIPTGGTVHVAEAKLPSNKTANDEPAIKMFAETTDIEADGSAIHVAHETELHRGAVINLKGAMLYTGENGRWIDSKDDYTINTGLTVLDVAGGEELARKMTAPSRVLLMDGAGQLRVREEIEDSTDVRNLRYVFTDKPRKPAQGPGVEIGAGEMRRGIGRDR